MSSQILNTLNDIESYSYLELGVHDCKNFDNIRAKRKFSVDIKSSANFKGSTDEYFEQLSPFYKFDIIFIDANHRIDYVTRDYNNAIKHCNKWILIHDMIPPDEAHTDDIFCSNSFILLFYILKETNIKVYPMNENYGLTLVKMPAHPVYLSNEYLNASYKDFMSFLSTQKLYNREEITLILNNN